MVSYIFISTLVILMNLRIEIRRFQLHASQYWYFNQVFYYVQTYMHFVFLLYVNYNYHTLVYMYMVHTCFIYIILNEFHTLIFRTQIFQHFIKVALTKNPKKRPTAEKLLEVCYIIITKYVSHLVALERRVNLTTYTFYFLF